jgi:hypothetical protein
MVIAPPTRYSFFLLTIGSGVIANEPLRELLELLDYRIAA